MEKDSQKKPTGFSYYIEQDKLIAYKKLSTEDKLRWLEDINEITRLFQTKQAAKIREEFKGDFKASSR